MNDLATALDEMGPVERARLACDVVTEGDPERVAQITHALYHAHDGILAYLDVVAESRNRKDDDLEAAVWRLPIWGEFDGCGCGECPSPTLRKGCSCPECQEPPPLRRPGSCRSSGGPL